MDRLKDQVLIVTGGAHGIGRAYCEGLAGEGARVVVADIDGNGADAVAEALGEAGHDALAVAADVSQPESTDNMAQAAMERFGRIDGLVNNAAIYQRPAVTRGPFEEIPLDEWDRLMAVNLRGVFLSCRAVVPHMKKQGSGKIVNISSGTVFNGSAQMLHYVTSKAGVIGLTRALARELGDYNINVNAVAPGLTRTPWTDTWPAERKDRSVANTMLLRMVEPEDIADAMVYLCANKAVTGQTVVVDCGRMF